MGSNTTVIGATLQQSATIYGTLIVSAGISAAGATFSGNISAPNIVTSVNGQVGDVSIAGLGGNIVNTFNGLVGNVSGVGSLNGLTGNLALFGGTGISVFANSEGITLVNTGVVSVNGLTGASSTFRQSKFCLRRVGP